MCVSICWLFGLWPLQFRSNSWMNDFAVNVTMGTMGCNGITILLKIPQTSKHQILNSSHIFDLHEKVWTTLIFYVVQYTISHLIYLTIIKQVKQSNECRKQKASRSKECEVDSILHRITSHTHTRGRARARTRIIKLHLPFPLPPLTQLSLILFFFPSLPLILCVSLSLLPSFFSPERLSLIHI